MNRRDFLKTAFAGLVALVLPKGKAEGTAGTNACVEIADGERWAEIRTQMEDSVRWSRENCPSCSSDSPNTLMGKPFVWVDGFDDSVAVPSSQDIVLAAWGPSPEIIRIAKDAQLRNGNTELNYELLVRALTAMEF